jgi:tetratricopeptide (TPR) repeat protein
MSKNKHKLPSQKDLKDIFNYYINGRYDEAEKLAILITKKFPKHPFSWKILGETFRKRNKLSDSLRVIKIAIEINSQDHEAHNNLGLTLEILGKLEDAKISFQKAIELKSNFGTAHNHLGEVLKNLGKLEEAKVSFQKAIELKSNLDDAYYNLGKIFYSYKNYEKAAENFLLSNNKKSKIEILKCKYEKGDKNGFYKQLDYLVDKNEINAVIGSLICRSKIKYNINRNNPFCNYPLKYLYKTNLTKKYNFENIFIKTTKNILDNSNISYRKQNLLTNGIQTSGDILKQNNTSMDEIKKIIYSEVENYQRHFKDSDEGFIKNWPTSFDISAWFINMKNGGKLKAHIHDSGWLSGSIYINVPPKSEINSGNLVICTDYDESEIKNEENKIFSYNAISKFLYFIKLRALGLLAPDAHEAINPSDKEKKQKKIINVVTGSLCLFPSSLLHYTIPFKSEEERIVLAFDIKPK